MSQEKDFIGERHGLINVRAEHHMQIVVREVHFTITDLPISFNGCRILLKWSLPSGVYVDPYQLQYVSANNLTARFTAPVDVEQMAHKAEPLLLYTRSQPVCSITHCKFQQSLPLHVRYHLPEESGDQVVISLLPPTAYSSCSPSGHYPLDEQSGHWLLMDIPILKGQSISVPIGDLSHIILVTVFTAITSFFCILCIGVTLRKY